METNNNQKCSQNGCFCGDPVNCVELQPYKKLVWCTASDCLWNVPVKEGYHISYHKDWKPLGSADAYKGICGRREVGVKPETLMTGNVKRKIVECKFYSDRSLSGHIDFAKLLQPDGTPYGGNINSQQYGMPYSGEAFS